MERPRADLDRSIWMGRRTGLAIVSLLILGGVALRTYLLWKFSDLWFCSDEANLGLMVLRLIQRGEFHLFITHESYGGCLGVLTATLFTLLTGSQFIAMKLTALLYYVLFAIGLYLLGRALFDRLTAAIAVFLVSLAAPSFLCILGTRERGPHGEALAISVFALWLAVVATRSPRRRLLYFLWGILAGFGWYTYYATVLTVLPTGLFILIQEFRSSPARGRAIPHLWRTLWPVVPGALLGSLPYWVFVVSTRTLPPFSLHAQYPGPLVGIRNFLILALPVLTGGHWAFLPEDILPFFSKFTVYAYALSIAVFLYMGLRNRFRSPAFLAVGLQLVLCPLLFSFSSFSWFATEPRYLAGLYCSLPLVLAWAAMRLLRYSKVLAVALPLTVGVAAMVGAMETPATVFNTIFDEPTAPLIRFLEEHDLDHFYANYWITYRVMFESTPDPYTPPPLVGATYFKVVLNRYPDYTREVAGDRHPAYITWLDETGGFAEQLAREHRTCRRQDIGRFTVFYSIEPPIPH